MEFDLSRSNRVENTLRHHNEIRLSLILYREIRIFCFGVKETHKYILWAQCMVFVMWNVMVYEVPTGS